MSKKNIFVADAFSEDYIGGAELSTDALIAKTSRKIEKVKSHLLTSDYVEENRDSVWIFAIVAKKMLVK